MKEKEEEILPVTCAGCRYCWSLEIGRQCVQSGGEASVNVSVSVRDVERKRIQCCSSDTPCRHTRSPVSHRTRCSIVRLAGCLAFVRVIVAGADITTKFVHYQELSVWCWLAGITYLLLLCVLSTQLR